MKLLVVPTLAFLAAGCGVGQQTAVTQNGDRPKGDFMTVHPRGTDIPADCPLSVQFGSYAMGIDGGAAEAVGALLDSDAAVTSVDRYPWGREGEYTLCIAARTDADARRLFEAIARLFPASPLGPLSVSTRDGLRFDAPRP